MMSHRAPLAASLVRLPKAAAQTPRLKEFKEFKRIHLHIILIQDIQVNLHRN